MTAVLNSGNLFDAIAGSPGAEDMITLIDSAGVRIERIISRSHISPPGFWYDQDVDEWVMVVRGTAALEFDGAEVVDLKAGDYLLIPRHTRHRVARTGEHTIWLAVHLK